MTQQHFNWNLTQESYLNNHTDYSMIVLPYYNKPNIEGLILHLNCVIQCFIDSNIMLPIIIYHIPGRTGLRLSEDTLSQLINSGNLICIFTMVI